MEPKVYGVFRRVEFLTGAVVVLSMQSFLGPKAQEEANEYKREQDIKWRGAMELEVMIGRTPVQLQQMVLELGIASIGHAVLPVLAKESSLILSPSGGN